MYYYIYPLCIYTYDFFSFFLVKVGSLIHETMSGRHCIAANMLHHVDFFLAKLRWGALPGDHFRDVKF